jgi:cytochrome c oxidase subunit II
MFDRTSRIRRRGAAVVAVLLAGIVLAGCSDPAKDQDSLEPKGPISQKIMDLFTPFFWLSVVIGIGVIGGTIYAALRFREKPGSEAGAPKQVHGNTVLEISWTIIPALILVVMAAFTIPVIFDLNERPEGDDVVTVNVIAKQWFWEFEYCEQGTIQCGVILDEEVPEGESNGVDFVTANEMHIPVDRPISIHVTSPRAGVIHSFWVPNLAGKKDAVPGDDHFMQFEASETGLFLGQCAEYCGLSHADMRLRVFAQTNAEYEGWAEAQRQPVETGIDFATTAMVDTWQCSQCHTVGGVEGAVGVVGPNLTHLGDRSTFGSGLYETTLENLTDWVYQAPELKPFGQLNVEQRMPNFSENGMTRDEAEQIARFLLCDTSTDVSEVPEAEREVCAQEPQQ